jgi:hypothetical protein
MRGEERIIKINTFKNKVDAATLHITSYYNIITTSNNNNELFND